MNASQCLRPLLLFFWCAGLSQWAAAEAREQTVRLSTSGAGGSCTVQAVFRGDHDNCSNDRAGGRDDCASEKGCVCTRKEKHVSWDMAGRDAFEVHFDQGDKNPFVKYGSNECNFKSNDSGKLRCRVKGRDIPSGIYRYSVRVPHCQPLVTRLKIY
jgi:hypothetical protein